MPSAATLNYIRSVGFAEIARHVRLFASTWGLTPPPSAATLRFFRRIGFGTHRDGGRLEMRALCSGTLKKLGILFFFSRCISNTYYRQHNNNTAASAVCLRCATVVRSSILLGMFSRFYFTLLLLQQQFVLVVYWGYTGQYGQYLRVRYRAYYECIHRISGLRLVRLRVEQYCQH